jgi:hypothetical protein
MEGLQPKPISPQTSQSSSAPEVTSDLESIEARQEEARTVRYAIGKLNDFLRWFLAVLEVALALRFLFMLIAANTANLFTGFLYALTSIVLVPFAGILSSPAVAHQKGQVPTFELSTLIAMLVYWLIFWAIRRFLHILVSGPEEPISL